MAFGDVDIKSSQVKMYSNSGHPDLHHFYLELRNSHKELVDVELRDIVIKEGKKIPSTYIRRISLGRYEIEIDKQDLSFKSLKFAIQTKTLKHQLVRLKKPVLEYSSISILSNEHHLMKARLILKDKKGSGIQVQHEPEIIFTGIGEVSPIKMIKKGVWEFEISYIDANQIMYLSVRANGVLLEKLLRYQHVEKYLD